MSTAQEWALWLDQTWGAWETQARDGETFADAFAYLGAALAARSLPEPTERAAFRCGQCGGEPAWQMTRIGDVVVSWACNAHLTIECARLQRAWETTELSVVRSTPASVREAVAPADEPTA